MTKLIKTWAELEAVPDSDTHTIVIEDGCCGWIRPLSGDNMSVYLSTHTFYKKSGLAGSDIFKRYGFDIEIVSEEY
jgi:hypothetical protein